MEMFEFYLDKPIPATKNNIITYRDMNFHNICIEDVKKVEGWE